MRTAVFTALYPAARPYLNEFVCSVNEQTDLDFSLWVVNEGLSRPERWLQKLRVPYHIRQIDGTPAHVRRTGLQWVLGSGIDVLIFADADDRMGPGRVKQSKRLLSRRRMVFNELRPFRGRYRFTPVFKDRLREGGTIGTNALLDHNLLGLSNTAATAEQLRPALKGLTDDLIAFDWALFTAVLRNGIRAVFTRRCWTEYRQHGANTAGLIGATRSSVRRALAAKLRHYSLFSRAGDAWRSRQRKISRLLTRFEKDPRFALRYTTCVRRAARSGRFWWENIKNAEAYGL